MLDQSEGSIHSENIMSVNLHELMTDIDLMIRPAMVSKGLNYKQLCLSENVDLAWPSRVRVNGPALTHVMMNILANAHKVLCPNMSSVILCI